MTLNLPFQAEKTELSIGFLPLVDCAVLVAAQQRGFFEKYQLNVTLRKESSWANIRDRLAVGELDAAHMLAPMPLAASLGIDGLGIPMETAFSMGLNGSAITLSTALVDELKAIEPHYPNDAPQRASSLRALLDKNPTRKLTFAHVYPFSQHHYLLRAWLQDAGIDPEHDVTLKVIPPSHMVQQLQSGDIDGYCAGSPWNQVAVNQGIGQIAITSYEIWHNSPDKVLGVTQQWASSYPQTYRALMAALLEAAQWLDHTHNRLSIAEILAQPDYINVPISQLKPPLLGRFPYANHEPARYQPDYHCFYRYAANVPWHSQGAYFLKQMQACGQLSENQAQQTSLDLASVYRMDIYQDVARALNKPYPEQADKPEGKHHAAWVLHNASSPIAMGSSNIALDVLNTMING
jgi:ABC-type nitrate/sulfonate/bicarbonate transport system substrate-binding protein